MSSSERRASGQGGFGETPCHPDKLPSPPAELGAVARIVIPGTWGSVLPARGTVDSLRRRAINARRRREQARSSVVEHYLDTVGVRGSIPRGPTEEQGVGRFGRPPAVVSAAAWCRHGRSRAVAPPSVTHQARARAGLPNSLRRSPPRRRRRPPKILLRIPIPIAALKIPIAPPLVALVRVREKGGDRVLGMQGPPLVRRRFQGRPARRRLGAARYGRRYRERETKLSATGRQHRERRQAQRERETSSARTGGALLQHLAALLVLRGDGEVEVGRRDDELVHARASWSGPPE
jgi:hypothetical protein